MVRSPLGLPRPAERGTFLVVILILITIMSVLGIWALSTSRTGLLKGAHHRGGVAVLYEAEEGLQLAVRRMQELSKTSIGLFLDEPCMPCFTPDSDETDTFKLANQCPPVVNNRCPDPPPPWNPPCDEDAFFRDTDKDDGVGVGKDVVTGNVICNFMGETLPNTQISLVRKRDHVEAGRTYAIFLVNSVSRDSAARRRIVQGVAVLPYKGTAGAYILAPGDNVYLATILKSGAS